LTCTSGSSNFLTGFALHIKYIELDNPTYVRIFNISLTHPPDLAKVNTNRSANDELLRRSFTITYIMVRGGSNGGAGGRGPP